MATDNHTTIVGNLVEDPEVRFTQNGIAVANLRVAVTQRIQQDGEWRDGDTSFLRVNVWRGQAEHLADSLSKGDRVMVTGRLRQRSWETPEGDKRSVTEIEADEVGASLKWATAKVERTSQRGNGDRPRQGAAGRARRRLQRPTPLLAACFRRPRLSWGRRTLGETEQDLERRNPETKIARVATGSAAPRRAELGRAHRFSSLVAAPGHGGLISTLHLAQTPTCTTCGTTCRQ
jgi:single-strand DNA-binding protein